MWCSRMWAWKLLGIWFLNKVLCVVLAFQTCTLIHCFTPSGCDTSELIMSRPPSLCLYYYYYHITYNTNNNNNNHYYYYNYYYYYYYYHYYTYYYDYYYFVLPQWSGAARSENEWLPKHSWKPNRDVLVQTSQLPASFAWYMREQQRGTVSSKSRFQTVLVQQYSANLSEN